MKSFCVLPLVLAVSLGLHAQVKKEKPCIAFVSDSDNSANDEPAIEPLRTAVTLSGDFVFQKGEVGSCWHVHVLVLPLLDTNGWQYGYVVSYASVDPSGILIDHGLNTGPKDNSVVFENAMRKAAATVITNIHARNP